MGAFASVLPFLAALRKQVPDASASPVDMSGAVSAPSQVQAMQNPPAAPPAPPPDPQPDMSVGAGQTPNLGDITAGETGKAAQPRLSKGTQLMMLLRGGLQGGLAGMAQNAQTYAQTGRNAGFGGGLYGAQQLPFMQQYQRGELAQQGAQTELLKQQAQQINVPGYGNMPAGLAKVLFPSLIKGQATIGAAELGKQGRIGAAEVGKSVVVVPGKGMYQKDASGNYQPVQGAQLPNVLVTQEEAQNLGHPELGNQELPMAQYSQLLRGTAAQTVPVQGAQGASLVNKVTGKTQGLGLGSPAMGGIIQVGDPNNPGNVIYAPKTQAVGAESPQSSAVQVPKAAAKAEVPTNIGNQKVAFNTMISHAALLRDAATAVNNSDWRTLSNLTNRLKTEFGDADYTNLEAIANAYNHEVTTVISKGHITDTEVKKGDRTLPLDANLATINRVLDTYRALAQSKMDNLNKQKAAAVQQSQPQTNTIGPTAADLLKKYPPK